MKRIAFPRGTHFRRARVPSGGAGYGTDPLGIMGGNRRGLTWWRGAEGGERCRERSAGGAEEVCGLRAANSRPQGSNMALRAAPEVITPPSS